MTSIPILVWEGNNLVMKITNINKIESDIKWYENERI